MKLKQADDGLFDANSYFTSKPFWSTRGLPTDKNYVSGGGNDWDRFSWYGAHWNEVSDTWKKNQTLRSDTTTKVEQGAGYKTIANANFYEEYEDHEEGSYSGYHGDTNLKLEAKLEGDNLHFKLTSYGSSKWERGKIYSLYFLPVTISGEKEGVPLKNWNNDISDGINELESSVRYFERVWIAENTYQELANILIENLPLIAPGIYTEGVELQFYADEDEKQLIDLSAKVNSPQIYFKIISDGTKPTNIPLEVDGVANETKLFEVRFPYV